MRKVLPLLALACLPLAVGAAPPSRIVSLDLCTDWMLARHVETSRVAALSPLHRRFPVAWLGTGWPSHDGSLEQVLQLRPDLVITGEYNALQLRKRLEALGVRVAVLPLPRSLGEIRAYEEGMLGLLGLSASRASTAPAAVPGQGGRLLLLGANGIGTGRGTFEDGILTHAGWRNYLEETGYPRLDLEHVALDPPDAILWAAPGSQALANRFAEHPVLKRAVAPERWFRSDYWRWQCPGPWTWELIDELGKAQGGKALP
ncbi:MAG: ABC transporter substrate-binding protein [Pseudomonadota bacterium]